MLLSKNLSRKVQARKGRPGRALRLCAIGCLLLTCLWLVAWLGARWLIVSAPLERADAIVILSGSATRRERVQHAAHLFAQQRAQKILLTTDNQQGGWSAAEQRNPYSHEIAVKELLRLGVPSQNIEVVVPPVSSTWDEAVRISEYSRIHNLNSILIVTSSYHSRRALRSFRTRFQGSNTQIGLDPVATGIQTPPPATWWLHTRGWQMVAVEYFKLIYYRSRGR
jgi:uncharacterized SAM-binding protein YcdF (DUF218 family)